MAAIVTILGLAFVGVVSWARPQFTCTGAARSKFLADASGGSQI
jgi:hypothetical protein